MRHRAERITKVRIVDLDALCQGHGGAGDNGALMQAFGRGSASGTEDGAPDSARFPMELDRIS